MKASDILKRRLAINSVYGCDTFQIVDFEIMDDNFMQLYYDSRYNYEAHIYTLTFRLTEIERMIAGEEGYRCFDGEEIRTSTYRLID